MRLRSNVFIIVITIIVGSGVRGQTVRSATPSVLQQALSTELEGSEIAHNVKCGTPLLVLAIKNWARFSAETQLKIQQSLRRDERQKSRSSPTGRFRIHYDTTGIHAPALITSDAFPQRIPNTHEQYVDSVASIFERCWDVEVTSLGYPSPPSDGMQGGGNEYDIYIKYYDSHIFGETTWEPWDSIPGSATKRFPTYITIDNDYVDQRTTGMNGLKVTAAHEFFHAVQVGVYGFWESSEDFYFYELSSGWMEDVVYNDVNDYYFDVGRYLAEFRDSQKRSYSFVADEKSGYSGYERSLWAHFLAKRFGINVIKQIWSGIQKAPVLQSIATVLQQRGTDFEAEFALFSYWNYFTADRADTARFYPEGAFYPRFLPNVSLNYNGFKTSTATSAFPLSTQLIQIVIPGDTVTAIVTNIDVENAHDSTLEAKPFEIGFSPEPTNLPYQKLSKGVTAGFSADLKVYKILYLNSSTRTNASIALEPSPNPFRLQESKRLMLPISGTRATEAQVTIFSASLDRVLARRYPISESFDKRFIIIPSQDLRGRVASGIYFIYAQCDDAEFHWKVAIVQ